MSIQKERLYEYNMHSIVKNHLSSVVGSVSSSEPGSSRELIHKMRLLSITF
jgi:hypothetical protein